LCTGNRPSAPQVDQVGRNNPSVSSTSGDALRTLVANLSLHDRAVVPALTLSDGTALLTFAAYQAQSTGVEQVLDAALGVNVNILRTLCGSTWSPTEVLVPRVAPAGAEPFGRHFHAPARFNQEAATLVFPARDLDLQIAGVDPMMRTLLEERLQHLKGVQGSAFSDDIRRQLRTRLTSNRCSAEDIAALLAMHRRTLTRRLQGGGMGFRAIANETRFAIARQLLEDTGISLGQIASALGYSEASAFTRVPALVGPDVHRLAG
jgi:AraC-like DNA-binding protein